MLKHTHTHECDLTDDHKQASLPVEESISISIDQQSCYHVALTWESISHLGCTASLSFHDQEVEREGTKIIP